MRERNIVIFMLFAVLTLTLGCTKHDRSEEADRVTDELKGLMFKNPEQALARVDSAEQAGVFSASDANLLRVNIYWNIGQKRMAAFYGEQALADSDVKRKSPDETGRNAFFPNLRHTFPPVRHRSCWRFVILRQISEQYGNIICHSSSLGRRRHRGAPGSGGRRRLSAVAHLRQQCTPEIVSRREHGNARQIAEV